ncbi:MAG TPA: hypothetical protein VK459_02865, partial [Polyangiaceae bacterium]|nr:hypothetical protein [Polyangiaceae bacterium]
VVEEDVRVEDVIFLHVVRFEQPVELFGLPFAAFGRKPRREGSAKQSCGLSPGVDTRAVTLAGFAL